MWWRLSIFIILFGSAISLPVRAFAQTRSSLEI